MILHLNPGQMLDLWRTAAGLEPALGDASVERFDSIDVDMLMNRHLRAWYTDYLHTAAPDHLYVSDLTAGATVRRGPGHDWWTLELDSPEVRITEIEIEGLGPIEVVDPDNEDARPMLQRLRNRMYRHGCRPVALHRRGEPKALLNVAGSSAPGLKSVKGVVDDEEIYHIDERDIPLLARAARAVVWQQDTV